jgi:hypothetical protein
MKVLRIITLLASFAFPLLGAESPVKSKDVQSGSAQTTDSPDFVPVEKFKAFQKQMVEREMKAASSDFAVACINLSRDVKEKRLTVYSLVPNNRGTTNESGFKIQVIYDKSIAENHVDGMGTYQAHYNGCLLDFALAQYAEGKKALGLRLVRLLDEAEPRSWWSSPDIQPTSVKKILASLETDDGKIADILKQAVRDWHQRDTDYRPGAADR